MKDGVQISTAEVCAEAVLVRAHSLSNEVKRLGVSTRRGGAEIEKTGKRDVGKVTVRLKFSGQWMYLPYNVVSVVGPQKNV